MATGNSLDGVNKLNLSQPSRHPKEFVSRQGEEEPVWDLNTLVYCEWWTLSIKCEWDSLKWKWRDMAIQEEVVQQFVKIWRQGRKGKGTFIR